MGYNVYYECTLFASESESDVKLYFSRHEGLFEEPKLGCKEWLITIESGKVTMTFRSEKFYADYMTRMLKLLKERVPSLHGYVSCSENIYWIVAPGKEVVAHNLPNIHEFAEDMYTETEAMTQITLSSEQKLKICQQLIRWAEDCTYGIEAVREMCSDLNDDEWEKEFGFKPPSDWEDNKVGHLFYVVGIGEKPDETETNQNASNPPKKRKVKPVVSE